MAKKSSQLIFIDDSGDPGFKINRGASRLFVIACIIFDDPIDAEFASASIKLLKKQLGWKQEREFKFHRTNKKQREVFLKNAEAFNFRVFATVVDKKRALEPKLKKSDSFYQKVIIETLSRCKSVRQADIKLDGKQGKNYRNRSVAKIRQVLNEHNQKMRRFEVDNSKNNTLIQLADMVAGLIHAKYNPEKNIKISYFKYISNKIEEIYLYKG